MSNMTANRTMSVQKYIAGRSFAKGYADAKAGKPFNYEAYDDLSRQWKYERGRFFAQVYDGPIKDGRRVLPAAIYAFSKAWNENAII